MSPGIGFGEHGEGFVRIALVENEQRIRQAARNIRRFLETGAGNVAQRRPSRHAALDSAPSQQTSDAWLQAAESRYRRPRHGRRRRAALIAQQQRGADARAAAGRSRSSRCRRAIAQQEARRRSREACAGSPIRSRWRADPEHRRLRRTDRRRGRSGASGGRGRARGRQVGGHRQQGAAGAAWRRAGGARREAAASRSISRRRSPARIPIVKTLREGLAGNSRRAHLRHPQRHLQLHPDPHGAGEAVVRRLPRGGAAARLRRGRSDLRRRRPRHRAEARRSWRASPSAPRSIRRRSMSRASRRSRPPISKRPTNSAIASSCSASRCSTDKGIEQRVHPTMVPKDFADRPGDGRDQRGHRRCRRHRADHAGRARARAAWRPRRRWWPTSPISRAACALPPFGRPVGEAQAQRARRRCSATRAATTSACWPCDRPGTAATIATRLAEQNISLESIVQRHGGPRGGDDAPRAPRRRCR